jgi:hypothetical protein
MLQQQGAGVADDVEDTAPRLQARVIDRMVRRIVQGDLVELGDFHQIAQRQHALDVDDVGLFVEAELGGEHAAVLWVHAGYHFEPHDRREAAVAQLGLDHGQQIVGVFLVALGVGVARDAEQPAGLERHAGEEQVEVVRHDVFEAHEALAVADAHEARNTGADWHLDATHQRLGVLGMMAGDEQIERQIGDEGEGMRRIERQRRHEREDVLEIAVAQRALFAGVELLVLQELDAVLAQRFGQLERELALLALELAHHGVALGDLFLRRAAVDRPFLHAGGDLLLETADPLHEEFVEIRGRNRQEFHAFQKRIERILRLLQDARVEGQPGELAVQVELGGVEVFDQRRWRCDLGFPMRLAGLGGVAAQRRSAPGNGGFRDRRIGHGTPFCSMT